MISTSYNTRTIQNVTGLSGLTLPMLFSGIVTWIPKWGFNLSSTYIPIIYWDQTTRPDKHIAYKYNVP